MSELRAKIAACCKRLRLRQMTDNLDRVSETDPESFLLRLLELEVQHRDCSRVGRGIKNAGFYTLKSLEEFVFDEVTFPAQLTREQLTDLQYQLVSRAVRLGWPQQRVKVIDEDLGKSGASASQRSGFQNLIAEIGLGKVGLVLSFDASRLARNNYDWYRPSHPSSGIIRRTIDQCPIVVHNVYPAWKYGD